MVTLKSPPVAPLSASVSESDPIVAARLSPTVRDLRAHATYRLQVGLFGLCAMLMIVGLANIIMNRARLAEAQNPPAVTASAGVSDQKQVADPLVDIGVVPGTDPSATAAKTPDR